MPRTRRCRAPRHATPDRLSTLRQRELRRQSRDPARCIGPGDTSGQGGRRDGCRRIHPFANRPMTPRPLVDPGTAYARALMPAGIRLRLDANEGLPFGAVEAPDAETLRRYPDARSL